MGGWKSKLVFLLIVYFAGFATAIYCLVPVPENRAGQSGENSFAYAAFKSDEFAQSFNVGLHKFIDFSRTAAGHAGRFIKQKYDQYNDRGQSEG